MADTWDLVGGEQIAPGLIAVKPIGGGVVYEAWVAFDERLYAPVVTKLVRPSHVDNPVSRLGLEREVEVLSRLNHPGIVRIFDHDVTGERPRIVLENIDGPNLSWLISRHGALPVQQLLPLGLELASALHYLHGERVCHLDVKASNVVMGAPAKLIDLSLALDVAEAATLDHAVGTDEYMAPEQCRPGEERGTVGHPSDVWGFGVTMFRAAAGYRAFAREPRWLQLTDAPLDLPDHVPAPLRDLIGDCLAPDPADRPVPEAIAEALEPMLAAMPKARLSGFSLRR